MEGRYHRIAIEVAGRRWTGDWTLQGKDVCVGSAWGSAKAPLGRAKPENVAARVLKEIVAATPSGEPGA